MALTDEVVRKLSHEAGMLWNPDNAWGMLAKLIYDKACEDCAKACKERTRTSDTVADAMLKIDSELRIKACRALKHGGQDVAK